MWNHRSGECLRIFRFKSPPIYSLCVSKGRLFVGAGESCWVIDAFTGATGNRYNCRFGAINSIAVCDATDTLFVASGFIGQMFELSSGKSLRSVAGHTGLQNRFFPPFFAKYAPIHTLHPQASSPASVTWAECSTRPATPTSSHGMRTAPSTHAHRPAAAPQLTAATPPSPPDIPFLRWRWRAVSCFCVFC